MKKLNIKSLLVSSIIAAVTFIILEYFIELVFAKLFSISESIYFAHFHIDPSGTQFQLLNILIFFLLMVLIMYVYTLVRPEFKSNISAGIMSSLIFLLFLILMLFNFTNLGILTIKMSLTSIIFNLIELPPAILVGAILYGEG